MSLSSFATALRAHSPKVTTKSVIGGSSSVLKGSVTKSGVMDKTVTVCVDRQVEHPITHKLVTRTTKLLTHDPTNACQTGNRVIIKACRPLSARKHYVLDEILDPRPDQSIPTKSQLKIPLPKK